MFAKIVLIAAALAGQYNCQNGQCQVAQPMLFHQQVEPARQIRSQTQWGYYRTDINGIKVRVWGYIRIEGGKRRVVYSLKEGDNRRAYDEAYEVYHDGLSAGRTAEKISAEATAVVEKVTKAREREAAPETPVIGAAGADPFPGGVAYEKIGQGPSYRAHSSEAKQYVEAVQAESDGSGSLHVTVIGNTDERSRVVNDLENHPAFKGLDLMVQEYAPNEWAVDQSLGFQTNGTPAIVVQTSKSKADPKGGKVVYRASDYSMGPQKLAEEVRKADPNYRPDLDPGPANPPPAIPVPPEPASKCPFGFTSDHWGWILIVGIGLVVVLKLPSQKES